MFPFFALGALGALALLAAPSRAEAAFVRDATGVGVTASLSAVSEYVTDGFRVGAREPVLEPAISADLFSTGASLMFWSALRLNRAHAPNDEFDLFARFNRDLLFTSSRYAVNVHAFADYWYYPRSAQVSVDDFGNQLHRPMRSGNKLHAGLSLPRLVPLAGWFVVPSYNAYYWLYWVDNDRRKFAGGARHEFQLAYAHDVPTLLPGLKAQYVGTSLATSYNDGAFGVHPGWSHTVLQVGTSLHALDCIFSASVERQWSHQPSVDRENELWTTLSVSREL